MSLAQIDPEESEMPLSINEILPDVCLGRIFQFLPLRDKLRITAVCKRWKELSSLAWEEPKELNLGSQNLEELPPKARTLEGVVRLLQKCGSRLEELVVDSEPNGILPLIPRYCPKLTSLVAYIDFKDWRCNPYFPNLKSLKINGRMGSLSVVPEEVFRALPNDKMIEIEINVSDPIPEEPLHSVPNGVLSEFRQLETLVLNSLIISSHDMTAISQMSTLKCVDLSFSAIPHQLPSFTSLKNLDYLDLGENSDVTEHTLIEIANTCKKLESLTFRSLSVTNRGLSSLRSLPKLEHLEINDNNHITDALLGNFHNLITLGCPCCANIRDDGIIELLRNAPNLDYLDIRGTGVTQKVVEVANEVVKRRTNNCRLGLMLDLNSLEWPCVDEIAPLLYVTIYSGKSSKFYEWDE